MAKKSSKAAEKAAAETGETEAAEAEGAAAAAASPPAGAAREAESGARPRGGLPLFYREVRPLHLTRHADLRVQGTRDFSFAANATAIPLLMAEFPLAARDYPIVFSPDDPPTPVALTGIQKGNNLFVDENGAWRRGCYVPAYVRRYPFILVEAGEERRRVLCVDETAAMLSRDDGRPLVEDGAPSEIARTALQFCEAYLRDHRQTEAFVRALVDHDLFDSKDIQLRLSGERKMLLKDIRFVDAARFDKLGDDAVLDLRRQKLLYPTFCTFVAAANLQRLVDLAARG